MAQIASLSKAAGNTLVWAMLNIGQSKVASFLQMAMENNSPKARVINISDGAKQMHERLQAMQWWGYLHTSGTLHVKRYHPDFGDGDIDDAYDSPFCAKVMGPFNAPDRDAAIEFLAKSLVKSDA